MNNEDKIDLMWQRLLPIFVILTFISYLTGRTGVKEREISPTITCENVLSSADMAPNFKGGNIVKMKLFEFRWMQKFILDRIYFSGPLFNTNSISIR